MASCSNCGTVILFGGRREGNLRFCGDKCHQQAAWLVDANRIPESVVLAEAERIADGRCPICGGEGPVDVHIAHRVWSAGVITGSKSIPLVCCRRCGSKARVNGILFSGTLGWWGFPWGVILTPLQISRNLTGLVQGGASGGPSEALLQMVRLELAARGVGGPDEREQAAEQTPDQSEPRPPAALDPQFEPPHSIMPEPGHFDEAGPLFQERKSSGRSRAPVVVIAVILLFALVGAGGYLLVASMTSPRVWLVNGLDQPYDVMVNGDTHRLSAMSWKPIDVSEGDVEVVMMHPGADPTPMTARIDTPLLARPFRDSTHFINPDRTAVLIWEQAAYTGKSVRTPDPEPSRVTAGELLSSFEGVDFVLRDLPDEIDLETSSASKVHWREAVRLLNLEQGGLSLAWAVSVDHGDEAATELIRRRLAFDPDGLEDVSAMVNLLGVEQFIATAAAQLEERPIRLSWHRVYQEVQQSLGEQEALESQYRAMLEADPGNGDLAYLLGRLLDDPDEALAMFIRATEAKPPAPEAHMAIAYQHLVNGAYEDAEAATRQAYWTASIGELEHYTHIRDEIRHARGEFEPLRDLATVQRRNDVLDTAAAEAEVYWIARLGWGTDFAQQRIDAHVEALRLAMFTRDHRQQAGATCELTLCSATDDVDRFIRVASEHPALGFVSDARLLSGDVAGAVAALDAAERGDWRERLLVYCAATAAGDTTTAQTQLTRAIELIGSSSDQAWIDVASWLDSGESPDERAIRGLELWPTDKRVALVALACRFPDDRDRFASLARTLNYDRHWPYLLVRVALEGSGSD